MDLIPPDFWAAREKIDRFAYLPFGAGLRTCIGASFAAQETLIAVATLVRHLAFSLAPGFKVWPIQTATLRPKGGLPTVVQRH